MNKYGHNYGAKIPHTKITDTLKTNRHHNKGWREQNIYIKDI